MQAVILAGGFGTRLQPLTERTPKPMVPVVNRPILEYAIDSLRSLGVEDIVVLLYFQPQQIKDYFGDGADFGVRIRYASPQADYGSAGAVGSVRHLLTEQFLVMSGDIVSTLNLTELVRFHEEHRSTATMALYEEAGEVQYGWVKADAEGRVLALPDTVVRPEAAARHTVNTGIYVFEPDILRRFPEGEELDFLHGFFPAMLRDGEPLWGVTLPGYWKAIRTCTAYLEVHRDYFEGRLQVRSELPQVNGREARAGYGSRIARNVALEGKVVIGANTTVQEGAALRNCVVGNNCVIEQGASLENAVLWNNVFVRRNVRISGAVLADAVRVDRGARVDEGAIIAAGSAIGAEAHVRERVKVWPYKTLEPESTLATNLVWGAAARQSLFSGGSIAGLTNVELTPELMAKLGVAYGSTLPQDGRVCISRDGAKSSRMLKRAFLGGVSSTGVDVLDLKDIPLPVAKHAVRTSEAAGGVHFQQSATEPSTTELHFFDGAGLGITQAGEKVIEKLFHREDFRRVHFNEPGAIYEDPRVWDAYRSAFLAALGESDLGVLRTAALKVIVDFSNGPAAARTPELLAACGISLVTLNADPAKAGGSTLAHELDNVAKVVRALAADAGFLLYPDAMRLAIADDEGRVFQGVDAVLLAARLITEAHPAGALIVPENTPLGVGLMARERGFPLLATKLGERAVAEAASVRAAAGLHASGAVMFPGFMPVFDGVFAMVKLLALLARTGDRLSAAAARMPAAHWIAADVPVPGALKAGILHRLERVGAAREALTPGSLRLERGREWVLAVPDDTRGALHLYAEGTSDERAAAAIGKYRHRIERWVDELRAP